MKYFKYISVFVFLIAANTVYAESGACAININRAKDVLSCALENNSEILEAEAKIPIANTNKELSKRWINPELEGGVGYNKEDSDNRGMEIDLSIMQTIELPKKRKARVDRANIEYSYSKLNFDENRELITLQVLFILNRLRQINREKIILNKIIETFMKAIASYENTAILSVEDQVSLNLFKLALNNYNIEYNQLKNEENLYLGEIRRITNYNIKLVKNIFYYPPLKWPDVNEYIDIKDNIDLNKESLNIAKNQADYLELQSQNFSEFRVGVYAKTSPSRVDSIDNYGVKFSVPIPIYSNKKSSNAGKIAVRIAERNYEAKKFELYNSLEVLKKKYIMGVSSLKKFNIKAIENRRGNVEKSFAVGRINPSTLIEINRQIFDSVKIYHEYEIDTLQTLWEIYAIQKKLITNIGEVVYEG